MSSLIITHIFLAKPARPLPYQEFFYFFSNFAYFQQLLVSSGGCKKFRAELKVQDPKSTTSEFWVLFSCAVVMKLGVYDNPPVKPNERASKGRWQTVPQLKGKEIISSPIFDFMEPWRQSRSNRFKMNSILTKAGVRHFVSKSSILISRREISKAIIIKGNCDASFQTARWSNSNKNQHWGYMYDH